MRVPLIPTSLILNHFIVVHAVIINNLSAGDLVDFLDTFVYAAFCHDHLRAGGARELVFVLLMKLACQLSFDLPPSQLEKLHHPSTICLNVRV